MSIDRRALDLAGENLYEAALDHTLWPGALDRVAHAVSARGVFLARTPELPSGGPVSPGIADAMARYWAQGWNQADYRIQHGMATAARDGLVVDQDFITPEQMATNGYYQDMLAPVGLRWFAAILFQLGGEVWATSIQRSDLEGPFEDIDRGVLLGLREQLRACALIGQTAQRLELRGMMRGLDVIEQPAATLNRHGRVVEVNARLSKLIGDGLAIVNGRVHTTDLAAADKLDRTIRIAMAFDPRQPSDLSASLTPIPLRRANKSTLWLRIVPLPRPSALPTPKAVHAVLLVHDVDPPASAERSLRQTFGLTRGEALVAQQLLSGQALPDIAQALGVGRETVRTQLKNVFAKTDTKRQGELIRLLSRLPGI